MSTTDKTRKIPNKTTIMKSPTVDEHTHLESRVGRLEGAVETIAQEVKNTNQSVKEISNSLSSFKEDVLNKVGTIGTPKTSLIITYATLLVTIMGLCGTVIMMQISGQRDSTETLKAQMLLVQQTEAQNKFEDGKTSMWREFINDYIKSDSIKDEQALNALFDRIKCAYSKRLDNLEDLATEIRKWRLEHDTHNGEFKGNVEARLKQLENFIIKLEERQTKDRLDRLDRAENSLRVK